MDYQQLELPRTGASPDRRSRIDTALPLLTASQIADASQSQLEEAVRAINGRLTKIDEDAVLTVAFQTLHEHGVTDQVIIEVGVEDYDDGYFYEGITRIVDKFGKPLNLEQRIVDALAQALDEPLTTVSHNGSRPGRFSTLEIDLVRNVLSN